MRLRLLITLVCLSAAVFGASPGPAQAIVDGQLDGDRHPYVGVVRPLLPNLSRGPVCSGTLVSPRLVVTAAHCFFLAPTTPDRDVLFTTANPVELTTEYVHGTATLHPDFDPGTTTGFTHDVALIRLDAPYPGARTFARLPLPGFATLPFRHRELELVGYGLTGWIPVPTPPPPAVPAGNAAPPVFRYVKGVGTERAPESRHHLLLERGACHGDSGGPVLRNKTIVAVISFGLAPFCSGQAIGYRLDTFEALRFIVREAVSVHRGEWDDEGFRGRGKGREDD